MPTWRGRPVGPMIVANHGGRCMGLPEGDTKEDRANLVTLAGRRPSRSWPFGLSNAGDAYQRLASLTLDSRRKEKAPTHGSPYWCQNRPISGRGSRTVRLRIEGNKGHREHDVYPGSGPLNGGKTLLLA